MDKYFKIARHPVCSSFLLVEEDGQEVGRIVLFPEFREAVKNLSTFTLGRICIYGPQWKRAINQIPRRRTVTRGAVNAEIWGDERAFRGVDVRLIAEGRVLDTLARMAKRQRLERLARAK